MRLLPRRHGRTCFRRPRRDGASRSWRRPHAARRRSPRTVPGSAIRCAHGRPGWLVPHGDAPALARQYLALAGDRALVDRFGVAARRASPELLTWDAAADLTEAQLQDLIRPHRFPLTQGGFVQINRHGPSLRNFRGAPGACPRDRRPARHAGHRARSAAPLSLTWKAPGHSPSSGCSMPGANWSATARAPITARALDRAEERLRRQLETASGRSAGARRRVEATEALMLRLRDFLVRQDDPLQLEALTGDVGLDRQVPDPEVASPGTRAGRLHRPVRAAAAARAGRDRNHLSRFAAGRAERQRLLANFFSFDLPCVFVTKGLEVPAELLELARDKGVPILRSRSRRRSSTAASSRWSRRRSRRAPRCTARSPTCTASGSCSSGRSGIGKSECVLDLVERGHRLVADDVVQVTRRGTDILIGRGHELAGHHMEIRGIGLIDMQALFGVRAVRQQKRIEVVVQLEDWETAREDDRPHRPGAPDDRRCSACTCPRWWCRSIPGRTSPSISEVVAMMHLLRYAGVDVAAAFNDRLIKRMKEKRGRARATCRKTMSEPLRGVVVCHGAAGARRWWTRRRRSSGMSGRPRAGVATPAAIAGDLEARVEAAVGSGPAVVFVDMASGSCLFAVLRRLRERAERARGDRGEPRDAARFRVPSRPHARRGGRRARSRSARRRSGSRHDARAVPGRRPADSRAGGGRVGPAARDRSGSSWRTTRSRRATGSRTSTAWRCPPSSRWCSSTVADGGRSLRDWERDRERTAVLLGRASRRWPQLYRAAPGGRAADQPRRNSPPAGPRERLPYVYLTPRSIAC